MIRTYKRKLKLTVAQEQRISSWIGACRVVYNLGLEVKISAYKSRQKSIHKFELMKQITLVREIDWMADVPIGTMQDTMDRLDQAYTNFFKRGGGFPKWAKKDKYNSIKIKRLTLNEDGIKIPKIGNIRMFKDAPISGKCNSAIITKDPKGYFISMICHEVEPKFASESQAIGLDMGLSSFCIDSNGEFIANPRHFRKYERKLRVENRSLSRKRKGSSSWRKQAKKLRLLHHKVANVRKDFLHKESTKIAKVNSTVYIEGLKISNMVKNHCLSKSISDAGWGMFKNMLSYKTNVVLVNPAYTSQTCFECGTIDKKSRISQSEFVCTSCGQMSHADVNAAKNIMSKGIALERKRSAVAQA